VNGESRKLLRAKVAKDDRDAATAPKGACIFGDVYGTAEGARPDTHELFAGRTSEFVPFQNLLESDFFRSL
jgi:hypothetical protein